MITSFSRNEAFAAIAQSFVQQPALPFAEVLTAEQIAAAFDAHHAMFGQDDLYSAPLVLWAFLAQVLSDGKGAACASAVAQIATYLQLRGQRAPCGDTGDYCRARAKLNLAALRTLTIDAARQLEQQADPSWLWRGLHAKLIDGFTFTMPDTPANQREFPQLTCQKPGAGFPIARAATVVSLATGAACDLVVAPYEGKQTGETALLRKQLDALAPGDVAIFDRCLCSFLMLALLRQRGVEFCCRLHRHRKSDFRRGRRLGADDRLITWTRPKRPPWMTQAVYDAIPQTLTLRQVRFRLPRRGGGTETVIVVTSLTDPRAYPKHAIAELYGVRWNVELDIRVIKQTLRLDHVRCKSPDMVRREVWVTLLAYNLLRKLVATAAALHRRLPRQIGVTLACQEVLAVWMLRAAGAADEPRLWQTMLARIAANAVANRPGRVEPRAIKRRHDDFPLMHEPRSVLRAKLKAK
jgi:hypothetical protein